MIRPIEIKNFLNERECNSIIELSDSIGFKPAETAYESEIIKNLDFNKREIAYIKSDKLNEVVKNLSNNILNKINYLTIFKGLKYDNIGNYSFNKYSTNDFLNYHRDFHEIKFGATITVVLELSNDYDGGEFCYKYDDEEIQFEKGKGSLYIFDSNIMHKVNPITNGIRYSINCWPKYSIKKSLI